MLGGHAHGALDGQLLVLGALHQVAAHLLEMLHVARAEGDADAVHDGGLFLVVHAGWVVGGREKNWG